MEKPFVLFGAGGHAREVAEILEHSGHAVLGFLDENPANHDQLFEDWRVLGGFDWLEAHRSQCQLLVAIGHTASRKRIAERAEQLGVAIGSAISPEALISPRCALGAGAMVFPGVVLSTNVKIGRHVILGTHSSVSHDCTIGDFSFLCPGAKTTGSVVLEPEVMLGTNSCVIPGKRVGQGSVVGAGSTVIRDIPPGVTAVGTPAVWKRESHRQET